MKTRGVVIFFLVVLSVYRISLEGFLFFSFLLYCFGAGAGAGGCRDGGG
jgi:hypothetical protein